MAFLPKLQTLFSNMRSFPVFTTYRMYSSIPWRRFSDDLGLEKLKLKVAELEEAHGDFHADLISPYKNLAVAYVSSENYSRALFYFEKGIKIEEAKREESAEMITGYKNLSYLYQENNDSSSALKCLEKALKLEHRFLGESNPDLCDTYNSMISIMMKDGNFDGAFEVATKTIPIINDTIKNKDTLGAFYLNLGYLYTHKKMYEESLHTYGKAIENFKQVENSTRDIADVMYQIGLAYEMAEQFTKAAEAFEKSLNIGKDLFSHQEAAHIHSKCGDIFKLLGNNDSAIISFKKALESANMSEMASQTTRHYLLSLGKCYKIKGNLPKAQLHLESLLESAKEHKDLHSNDVAEACDLLYNININSKQTEKAMEYAELSLKIRETLTDIPSELLALSLANMGLGHSVLENWEKAEQFLLRAKEKLDSKQNHPLLATVSTSLGVLYREKNNVLEAIEHFEKALEILKQTSTDNIEIAHSYGILGNAYSANQEYEKAIHALDKAVEMLDGYIKQALFLDLLGNVYRECDKIDLAIKTHQQAIDLRIGELNKDYYSIGQGYHNLATDFRQAGNLEKALENHIYGKELLEESYGKNSSFVGSSYILIAEVYDSIGLNEEAKTSLDEAVKIFTELDGEESDVVRGLKDSRDSL